MRVFSESPLGLYFCEELCNEWGWEAGQISFHLGHDLILMDNLF